MAPSILHLPNGHTLTVTQVFGGLSFKNSDLNPQHRSAFPPGWTIVLNEEDGGDDADAGHESDPAPPRRHVVHRYKKPSLQNDHLFISSISYPNSAEYKPTGSPTRQIAMMLWATLWWYFHQPEPEPGLMTTASAKTVEEGRPKGDWRININREGIFKGRMLLSKLERMGLIISDDSSVGCGVDDRHAAATHSKHFITRRAFWQVDPRIFLFSLAPVAGSPYPASSPFSSRPSSPNRSGSPGESHHDNAPRGTLTPINGPYQSSSHLPTYYPPHPAQYVFTNGVRHPLRPKPFRQGETIYSRYIPSLGQYLTFRIASLSTKACHERGPWSSIASALPSMPGLRSNLHQSSTSDAILPTMSSFESNQNDVELLHKWMNDDRVAHFWGESGPQAHQEEFLHKALSSKHSFPVIGCWDGKPFGYFEIYYVKEDILGRYMIGEVGEWDRGIHCLIGEQDFRGPHRVTVWLSALVHYCWLNDMRTNCVMLEPRVDNLK